MEMRLRLRAEPACAELRRRQLGTSAESPPEDHRARAQHAAARAVVTWLTYVPEREQHSSSEVLPNDERIRATLSARARTWHGGGGRQRGKAIDARVHP